MGCGSEMKCFLLFLVFSAIVFILLSALCFNNLNGLNSVRVLKIIQLLAILSCIVSVCCIPGMTPFILDAVAFVFLCISSTIKHLLYRKE